MSAIEVLHVAEPYAAELMARSINSLPVETMNRIFAFACAKRWCPAGWSAICDRVETYTSTNVPIIISHVCSRWRHIAINHQDLWTHIDLIQGNFAGGRDLTGAQTYLARAGEKLLDIHISTSPCVRPQLYTEESLIAFVTDTASRTWSLKVDVSTSDEIFCRLISVFLERCVPGNLTKFCITHDASFSPLCGNRALTHLGQQEPMVEALWLPVIAVHLSSAYPKWTSKLYQGLTELRLSNPREPTEFIARPLPTPIPESALVAILKSSPKLRILQMGLIIKDATSVRNPVKPVLLEDLELLVVDTRRDQHVVFMKLVRPGPKPLTLSVADSSYLNEISSTGRSYAEEFLTSSNITRLILTSFVEYPDLTNLLSLLPKVRVLALEELLSRQQITDTNSLPLSFTIDTLYVTHCFHTPFEDYNIQVWSLIEEVVRRHSVAELVLWGYNDSAESIVPEHIYTVCPSVSVLWGGLDPIKEFK